MPKPLTRTFEALLILAVLAVVLFGATWLGTSPITLPRQPSVDAAGASTSADAGPTPAPIDATIAAITTNGAPIDPEATAIPAAASDVVTPTDAAQSASSPTSAAAQQPPTSLDANFGPSDLDANDAPLLEQAAGTINFLLIGSDASADRRYARTDSIIVASINPEIPSVSMLSIPRDTHVRIPGFGEDRINTAFERGYQSEYPGGGPRFLALVLRKNFGIHIDHFVRIDFQGFIKAIDTLGGIEVLAECELHDTFPDPQNPRRGIDLDVYPGRVSLTGQQALWYSRSRWSTSDFDRARRQQKVLRAVLRKARQSDLLQNAIGLYGDFRDNVETSVGIGDLTSLVDIARRLDDITIKNRVITFPVVKSVTRADGAMVLQPQSDILAYVAEALAPPVANRVQTRLGVEVSNASSRTDMELVAAERLTWEGFLVVGTETRQEKFPKTQIVDFSTSPKGSPIPRLRSIFDVAGEDVIGQADPSSPSVARIVLGEDYQSCPNTANIAADVVTQPAAGTLIPTATP
jgi:LCP family protein required for cell wall assembly